MTHPAILKANEFHDDRSQALEPNQQALIASVSRILDRKTQAYAAAHRVVGTIPRMYRSWLIVADDRARNELDAALSTYFASLEYEDEIEAVALAVA